MPRQTPAHYVPKFLFGRFAIDPTDKASLVFKLEIKSGTPERVNPTKEAVRSHYNRLATEDSEVKNLRTRSLIGLNDEAARRIHQLVDHPEGRPSDLDGF